jgi:hypothetical protein
VVWFRRFEGHKVGTIKANVQEIAIDFFAASTGHAPSLAVAPGRTGCGLQLDDPLRSLAHLPATVSALKKSIVVAWMKTRKSLRSAEIPKLRRTGLPGRHRQGEEPCSSTSPAHP